MNFAPGTRATTRNFASRLGLVAVLTLATIPPLARGEPRHGVTVPAPPPTLAQSINAYISGSQFQRADWGIAVRSLDTGQSLYRHNAGRLFVPASNTKLLTAALALATLGPDTRIATTLYATTPHVSAKGVLRGDLILYGRGDPSLGAKDVSPDWAKQLAAALAERGVKRIRGDLIADSTYFSGAPAAGGREADDLQAAYGAMPLALDVQENQMRVTVTRDGRRCCTLTVTPQAAEIHIDNLTDAGIDPIFGLYRPVGSSTLYAIGQLPAGTRTRTYVLSMPDPARTAGNLLRTALAQQGIALTGKLRVLHWPQPDPALSGSGLTAIASIDSPSIAQLVRHMLKKSDNLYAQTLLLQAGVAAAQRRDCRLPRAPDTSAGWGLCALRNLLTQAGIPADAVRLAEGSGLSRRDLATPQALVHLLAWAMTQPWGPDLRNALPIAGEDGTLEYRFVDGPATGNLRAKTGTLNHVYTLTGLVTNAGGEHLAFSIMLNRYPRHAIARAAPEAPTPENALDEVAGMITQSLSIGYAGGSVATAGTADSAEHTGTFDRHQGAASTGTASCEGCRQR